MLRACVVYLQMHNVHDAPYLPIGKMLGQAEFVRRSENKRMASEGVLFHAAAAGIMTEKGGKYFQDQIKRLMKDG